MLILSIESSCDETAAAVVEMNENVRIARSDAVSSQIDIHALYGGVVPEIASRAHMEAISAVTEKALSDAGVSADDIDAVAVTNHPGLIGSLLVGVCYAKGLAYSLGVPLIPVDHIKAHTAAAYLAYPDLEPPFLSLVISGGHTSMYSVTDHVTYEEIGGTRDDAAGEAFDKVGRMMGMTYPCGAAMDKLSAAGYECGLGSVKFPSPAVGGDDSLDFSFSGLKTAAVNYIHTFRQRAGLSPNDPLPEEFRMDTAASFTSAVVSGICAKLRLAVSRTGMKQIVLAGGVAANSHIRRAVEDLCRDMGVTLCAVPLKLCGDNGSMVGAQGYFDYLAGARADLELNAYATDDI